MKYAENCQLYGTTDLNAALGYLPLSIA